jgi:hypothetical protein
MTNCRHLALSGKRRKQAAGKTLPGPTKSSQNWLKTLLFAAKTAENKVGTPIAIPWS